MPPPRVYILIRIHFTGFGVLSSLGDGDFKVLEGFCGHRDFKVFRGGIFNPIGLLLFSIYEPGGYKVYYTVHRAFCQVFS